MNKQIEAMKLAIRSLKELVPDDSDHAPAIQGQRKRQENAIKALQKALAEQPAQQEPSIPADDKFLLGVCVVLQVVTASGDCVLWRQIVEVVGADELFQYAAHIEPEEWELAGFEVFAREEMNRGKPRRLARRRSPKQQRSKNEKSD